MFFARSGTGIDLFKQAILAHEVFFFGVSICVCSFLLAVNKATKVWFLARIALVKTTSVHRILLWLSEVVIAFKRESFIV